MIWRIGGLAVAVSMIGGGEAPAPALPALNAAVVEFARSREGRPVGDGICITLAVEALKAAGARGPSFAEADGNYAWGEPVGSMGEALPGDILQFRDAIFDGKRTTGRRRWATWHDEYPHHTAIVAAVSADGKVVTILHQNVARAGEVESARGNVREGTLRMDSLRSGWVKAYRPVARPGR